MIFRFASGAHLQTLEAKDNYLAAGSKRSDLWRIGIRVVINHIPFKINVAQPPGM